MRLVPKRLALKLILSLTVLVAVVAGVSGFLTVKAQERQLLDAMILGADQLSRAITSATWHSMQADRRDAAYEVMQTIALKQGIARIRIFNKEGKIMFSTEAGDGGQVDKYAESCALCHASGQPLVKVEVPSRARIISVKGGGRRLAMVTPIYNEPACSQAACHAHPAEMSVLGVLDVAFDLGPVDREVAATQYRVLMVTGIEILLMGLFIIFFTRHFVGIPIRNLIRGTQEVSMMHLDSPIDISGSGEIGDLARSFNAMRDRLRGALGEITQFTQSLESKVEERTDQLNAAHRKLMQTDRLASLGRLSASVAHEINNPLSGVLNLSMLMQRILKEDGIPKGRVEEFRKYLAQVVSETSRVGKIVSDLLAFSRRSKPQRAQTDLNAIIKGTLSLLSHKLKLGNVDVKLDLAPDLPLILCDSSQMQEVVINLLMNGAEATYARSPGTVSLATRTGPDGATVIFRVTDSGDGIAPEVLPRIFDPFFTTKEEGKGVGLGLAVVYGIVNAHGGDIEVSTGVGEGTTFTVKLPVSGAGAQGAASTEEVA